MPAEICAIRSGYIEDVFGMLDKKSSCYIISYSQCFYGLQSTTLCVAKLAVGVSSSEGNGTEQNKKSNSTDMSVDKAHMT